MLSIKIERKGKHLSTECTASGEVIEIVADFGLAIGHIYTNLAQHDRDAAEGFRMAMLRMMLLPDLWNMKNPDGATAVVMVQEGKRNAGN